MRRYWRHHIRRERSSFSVHCLGQPLRKPRPSGSICSNISSRIARTTASSYPARLQVLSKAYVLSRQAGQSCGSPPHSPSFQAEAALRPRIGCREPVRMLRANPRRSEHASRSSAASRKPGIQRKKHADDRVADIRQSTPPASAPAAHTPRRSAAAHPEIYFSLGLIEEGMYAAVTSVLFAWPAP